MFSWSSSSETDDLYNVTTTAQYFFNGKGYEDPGLFTESPEAVAGLAQAGALAPDDLAERGQHYLGANVTAPEVGDSDVTPTVLWLANLGDGSGLVNARLNYAPNDFLTPRWSTASATARRAPNTTPAANGTV